MSSTAALSSPRTGVLWLSVAIASAGLMLWAYAAMAGKREAARAAAAEAAECRSLASRIEGFRQRSETQLTATASKGALIQRITTAALAAGLDGDSLDRIEPATQHPGGEPGGSTEQARVYLKRVTLHQAVAFFHDINASSSLSVAHIRFIAGVNAASASGAEEAATAGANRWAVEATLNRRAGGVASRTD